VGRRFDYRFWIFFSGRGKGYCLGCWKSPCSSFPIPQGFFSGYLQKNKTLCQFMLELLMASLPTSWSNFHLMATFPSEARSLLSSVFKWSILVKYYLSYFIMPNSCISPMNCFGKYLPSGKVFLV